MPATNAIVQKGSPTNPFLELQSNKGPVTKGPIERARQLKDAEAPLMAESSLAEDAMFVILSQVSTASLGLAVICRLSGYEECTHRIAEQT